MLQKQKTQITSIQTAVFTISIIVGMGVLTLPRTITERTQTSDGWISLILAGIIFLVWGRLIILLNRYYPDLTFFEYIPLILGKWLGNLVNFLFILYMILTAGYQLRGMSEVTYLYLLPTTPDSVKILIFLFVAIYLITGGIIPIARICEILLPITFIVFAFVLLLSFREFEPDNIRPVMGLGITPVLKGIPGAILAITGFEIMLILNAYMDQKKNAWKVLVASITIPTAFYIVIYITAIGALGMHQVTAHPFPTLEMLRSYEVTGILFERYESFLLTVWIMQIFTTYVGVHYFASLGLSQMTGRNIRYFIYGLAPLHFLISLTPNNINEIFKLGDIYSYIQLFVTLVAVPAALGIAWLRNRLSHPGK
ncbi:MAG: GerAB/ArcD/ProY family transporter [Thermoactinomyces sp.]